MDSWAPVADSSGSARHARRGVSRHEPTGPSSPAPGHDLAQDRGCYEHRTRADRHADEQNQRQVHERRGTEQTGSDEQDRPDRQKSHDRGVDRPDQRLVPGPGLASSP